mmetsp:Transcript_7331/g.19030  ORF Transcript_7331/g.19030 Transcript_7331/m.19030 type:complete len:358 (+) Transcript_7331:1957-3030(+)
MACGGSCEWKEPGCSKSGMGMGSVVAKSEPSKSLIMLMPIGSYEEFVVAVVAVIVVAGGCEGVDADADCGGGGGGGGGGRCGSGCWSGCFGSRGGRLSLRLRRTRTWRANALGKLIRERTKDVADAFILLQPNGVRRRLRGLVVVVRNLERLQALHERQRNVENLVIQPIANLMVMREHVHKLVYALVLHWRRLRRGRVRVVLRQANVLRIHVLAKPMRERSRHVVVPRVPRQLDVQAVVILTILRRTLNANVVRPLRCAVEWKESNDLAIAHVLEKLHHRVVPRMAVRGCCSVRQRRGVAHHHLGSTGGSGSLLRGNFRHALVADDVSILELRFAQRLRECYFFNHHRLVLHLLKQ